MTLIKKLSCFVFSVWIGLLSGSTPLLAQETKPAATQESAADKEAAYTRTLTQRANKIVKTLNLLDESKATKVQNIIVQQYRDLNEIHSDRDARVKAAKANASPNKVAAEAEVKKLKKKLWVN